MTISKGIKYVFVVIAIVLTAVIIWGYATGGVFFLATASLVAGMFLYMIYDLRAKKSAFRRTQEAKLVQARNFERAGRYEDAALIYEELQMLDKAGEMRRKDKTFYHEGRTINLDLNSLLQQIREKGISVPYRCPNCGANTRIDRNSNLPNLRACMYCNSVFETMPLKDFLDPLLR